MKITKTSLAKDILKWLDPSSKVKIEPVRNYCYVAGPKDDEETDIQKILLAGKVCEVCAKGAFIAAKAFHVDGIELDIPATARYNKAADDGKQSLNVGTITDTCDGIFSITEARLIEIAFERGIGVPWRITTASGRLTWICKNIVSHRGKFVPLPE